MNINKSDVVNYFESGIKKDSECRIGIEHEKFLFNKNTQKRIDYITIKKLFNELFEFGWKPIYEGKNIIALNNGKKNITLEPGNQIELAGEKLNNIHETCSESQDYLFELKQASKKLNLSILSSGFDPVSKIEEIPSNPKKRYSLMTNEMPKNKPLSLDMMYRSCGTQINLDYTSEKDFSKKFLISSRIVPLIIAMFANSGIVEKKNSGYLSYRSHVWQNTSRGGLPKIFLEKMDFEKYSDFAINYPLLFIFRNEEYINPNGKTFKDFIDGNIKNVSLPNISDLSNHLSTIFTENRLKKYIEIRSIDACGWDCLCAGPALLTGLIYGNIDETFDLIKKWKIENILSAYEEAPKRGFNTSFEGKDLYYWSNLVFTIAKKGLDKRNILNNKNLNESKFLSHLEEIIKNKNTNAENILNKFRKNKDLINFDEK